MRHAAVGIVLGLVPLAYFVATLPESCGDGLCTEGAVLGGVVFGVPVGGFAGLLSWTLDWGPKRVRPSDDG